MSHLLSNPKVADAGGSKTMKCKNKTTYMCTQSILTASGGITLGWMGHPKGCLLCWVKQMGFPFHLSRGRWKIKSPNMILQKSGFLAPLMSWTGKWPTKSTQETWNLDCIKTILELRFKIENISGRDRDLRRNNSWKVRKNFLSIVIDILWCFILEWHSFAPELTSFLLWRGYKRVEQPEDKV